MKSLGERRKAKAIACGVATATTVIEDYIERPGSFPKGPRCAVASLARAQLLMQHTYKSAVTEEERSLAGQAAEREVDRYETFARIWAIASYG